MNMTSIETRPSLSMLGTNRLGSSSARCRSNLVLGPPQPAIVR